jgi:hypothetical protein
MAPRAVITAMAPPVVAATPGQVGVVVPLLARPHPPGGRVGQFGRGTGELDLSLQQHEDTGADRGDVVGLMGGQHDHRIARQLRQQLPEPQPLLRIQSGGRLVEDQQVRGAEQRLGDPDTLPHPTRQRAHPPAGDTFQSGGGHYPGHLVGSAASIRDLLQDRDIVQESGDGEVPVIPEVLGEVAEPAADLDPFGPVAVVQAEHRHLARVGLRDRGQHRQQGRLPGAVRAQQAGDTPLDRQVDLGQCLRRSVPAGQALDTDRGGVHVVGHLIHPNST